jgi:azurin
MKKLILISLAFILISCGPSPEERQDIAQLTCNIMAESRNMDAAFRIKEINAAREKLGEPVYLGSDEKIKESFEYDLCVSLVLNDGYDQKKNAIDLAIEEEKRKEREEERKRREAEEELVDKVEFAVKQQGISYTAAIEQVLSEFNGYEFELNKSSLELNLYEKLLEERLAEQNRPSCKHVIEGNDMLQFNLQVMRVPAACDNVTVTLKHTGAMPANIMGHNWVLTNNTDFIPVAQAGGAAGLENNYIPVGDQRVLAATTVIGGGQETSVTFSIDSLVVGDDYTFFCSFPGHYAIMKGSFKIIR